jgi:anti-sigma-K factor RskA
VIRDDKNSAGSGAYVLNAMDEREREEFEAQLAESEELRNEVTELTDTAVLLGLAVEPVTPPAALKQNIMARLSQTPQLPREVEADTFVPVRTLRAVPALVSEEPRQVRPLHAAASPAATKAQARWYTRPTTAVLGVAAAIAIVVGGITATNLVTENTVNSQNASALATINTASDVQRAAASVSTGGSATLVWSNKLGKSVLIGKNLKSLPSDKTYELWYINAGGHATPAGTFNSDGKSTVEALTGTMGKGDTVGLTVEPAGGSKAPTTTPVVAIQSA